MKDDPELAVILTGATPKGEEICTAVRSAVAIGVVELSDKVESGEAIPPSTCKAGAGVSPVGHIVMAALRVSPTSVPGLAKFLCTVACSPSPPGRRSPL